TALGILYLPSDLRLRITNRDPKVCNLLDAERNPKILDFGLARICRGERVKGITS
ncbi:Tyrosine-protein kinase, partial [Parasponia andersonii]